MTKKLTAAQIKGYKRRVFIEKVNNLKTNTQQQKMKYYAASLLAVASYALRLKQDGCPEKPEEATPEDVFKLIDADGSGAIDSVEGAMGLGCLVKWGVFTQAEADEAGDKFAEAAGADQLLTMEEVRTVIGSSSDDDDLAQ